MDWLNMPGVILFTAAKGMVELRTIYAHLFKGRAARVYGWYHGAVVCFFIGGLLFGVFLILVFQKGGQMSLAQTSMSSSVFFLLGSSAFIIDAYPQALADNFVCAPSNSYFLGSLLFLIWSVCWIVASSTLYPATRKREALQNIFNSLAGIMYVLGSSGFLILGYFEMHQFNRGPDMDLTALL
jgi:hypothetical protein